jgi:hypothetical protein
MGSKPMHLITVTQTIRGFSRVAPHPLVKDLLWVNNNKMIQSERDIACIMSHVIPLTRPRGSSNSWACSSLVNEIRAGKRATKHSSETDLKGPSRGNA